MMERVDAQRKSVEGEVEPIPALAMLANDTSALATKEVEKFSPVLKKWHLCAGGIAAVTLHACYRREIKQYVSRLDALTPVAQQVLEAADLLEKSLVQIAVEEGADAEDGGKALIREMPPFETDRIVGDLAKKWVQQRLKKLGDWVSRNVEQEVTPSVCTHNFFLSLAIVWFMMERIVLCNTGIFCLWGMEWLQRFVIVVLQRSTKWEVALNGINGMSWNVFSIFPPTTISLAVRKCSCGKRTLTCKVV
jgi:hypothetical protein